MNLIDLPQGGRIPVSIGGKQPIVIKAGTPPIKVVMTPTPAKKSQLTKTKDKPKPGSVLDVILQGVLPIATNPVIPGTSLTLLPAQPGKITTPISPNVPVLGAVPGAVGGVVDAIGDIKMPNISLPAFPDLGLPNIGKFFDDLKVGGGLVLLGIGGLIALLIITRK